MAQAAKKDEKDELNTITPEGRAVFVHVWEPRQFKNSQPGEKTKDPQYGLILVFDEGTDLSDLKRTVARAAAKKFGAEEAKALQKKGRQHVPWRDASDYDKHGEPFEEGNIMISANSRGAPGVVDARAKPILKQQDAYSGCRARISVYAHAYEYMGKKGVTLLLNNVQKLRDDKRLAGRKNAEDEFGALDAPDSTDVDDLF